MKSRRQLLSTIGAIGIGSTTFGRNASAGVAGQDPVHNLLKQGKFKAARRILEDRGGDYFADIARGEHLYGANDGASTQDWYSKDGDGYVSTFVWTPSNVPDHHREVLMSWDLHVYKSPYEPDYPDPTDVAAIAWEDSQFGHVDGTTEVETTLYYGETGGQGELDWSEQRSGKHEVVSKAVIDKPGNAIVTEIRDGDELGWWEYSGSETLEAVRNKGNFSCQVRKQDDALGRIATKYGHTWSILQSANWNVIEGVSVSSGPVGISIDVPTGTDKWEKDSQTDE